MLAIDDTVAQATLRELGCEVTINDEKVQFSMPKGWSRLFRFNRQSRKPGNIILIDEYKRKRAQVIIEPKAYAYTSIEFIARYSVFTIEPDSVCDSIQAIVSDNIKGVAVYKSDLVFVDFFYFDTDTYEIIDKDDMEEAWIDTGVVVKDYDEEDYQEGYEIIMTDAMGWLDTNFPNWKNPLAYWDEKDE